MPNGYTIVKLRVQRPDSQRAGSSRHRSRAVPCRTNKVPFEGIEMKKYRPGWYDPAGMSANHSPSSFPSDLASGSLFLWLAERVPVKFLDWERGASGIIGRLASSKVLSSPKVLQSSDPGTMDNESTTPCLRLVYRQCHR